MDMLQFYLISNSGTHFVTNFDFVKTIKNNKYKLSLFHLCDLLNQQQNFNNQVG